MSINQYDLGDRIRLVGTFKDEDGVVADPSEVIVRVKSSDGTVTTPAVTQEALGVYHADVSPDLAGTWWYRFEGAGDVQAAEEQAFLVRESRF